MVVLTFKIAFVKYSNFLTLVTNFYQVLHNSDTLLQYIYDLTEKPASVKIMHILTLAIGKRIGWWYGRIQHFVRLIGGNGIAIFCSFVCQ